MPISETTRRRLFDTLTAEQINWHGNMSTTDFLGRLYDLAKLPSKDNRFRTASTDIRTHTEDFSDWPVHWVYDDDRFNLLSCSDERLLAFLCQMLNPAVRDAREEVEHLLDLFNDALSTEGWSIVEDRKVAGKTFYTYQGSAGAQSVVAVTSSGQRLILPSGFHHLADPYSAFLRDHPNPDENAFLIMRIRDTDPHKRIHKALRDSLAPYGLDICRADDKEYSPELWSNVCVYMLGCKYGIAVFEEINEREPNPNISLELGFMLALQRRCLILKDKRMPRIPSDIIGHLYKPFDSYDIESTLGDAVGKRANDVGLLPF